MGTDSPLRGMVETVAEQLEKEIREGHCQTGDPVPTQYELCERFGVSRTVIRESLKTLQAKGLIRIQQGRRTICLGTPPGKELPELLLNNYQGVASTIKVMEQLMLIGVSLLVGTTTLSIMRATKEDYAHLRELASQLELSSRMDEVAERDRALCDAMANISGDPLYLNLHNTYADCIKKYHFDLMRVSYGIKESLTAFWLQLIDQMENSQYDQALKTLDEMNQLKHNNRLQRLESYSD